MKYQLYYWPIYFRGDFIRLILEDAGVAYQENSVEELIKIKSLPIKEQPFPAMAPPFFHDPENDLFINQMPAIVLYVSNKLNYITNDIVKDNLGLKLVLDCNDVLAEITNLNGSKMWEHNDWKDFRKNRLKKWLEIFEEFGKKYGLGSNSETMLGTENITFADISTYALWGTMTRCIHELRADLETHAPNIAALCDRISVRKNISKYLKEKQDIWGNLYCGGQIEKSIRKMIELDKQ